MCALFLKHGLLSSRQFLSEKKENSLAFSLRPVHPTRRSSLSKLTSKATFCALVIFTFEQCTYLQVLCLISWVENDDALETFGIVVLHVIMRLKLGTHEKLSVKFLDNAVHRRLARPSFKQARAHSYAEHVAFSSNCSIAFAHLRVLFIHSAICHSKVLQAAKSDFALQWR